jgi:predicted TIM-barrel enzyme
MAKQYSRQEFLSRLWTEVRSGKPIVMAGAGNGLVAKFIEKGGIDIVGVYNTGYFRMQGYGSLAGMLPLADANQLVFDMGQKEILPQVTETPVIAGLNGVDVLRDMPLFLQDCKRIGFSGVHNFPTVGWFEGEFRKTLEGSGLGFDKELHMLNTARELDMVTIGYAFNEEDTLRLMKGAMPDIFIFHAGITRGGSTGFEGARSLDEMIARIRKCCALAKEIKADVMMLAHGASLTDPEDAQLVLERSECHGVQVGSSIERLAIEKPLEQRALAFKSIQFPRERHISRC